MVIFQLCAKQKIKYLAVWWIFHLKQVRVQINGTSVNFVKKYILQSLLKTFRTHTFRTNDQRACTLCMYIVNIKNKKILYVTFFKT